MARTELPNGIILPAEYSDDWYDDMTSNLSKLDEVIGSDAEKLSEEDVGAAALSNDYTDLDNKPDLKPVATSGDYDDLDNKPDLKPVATSGDYDDLDNKPDLKPVATSGDYDDLDNKPDLNPYDQHLANTEIHVTTADKNRWNNQTYVFRYSSTALVASSTNSNTLLDNTDNLKVGDKVIDSSGVLFSITAIDTQNSTFTIGTALIDLAQDSDVVHKSGNETVGGIKTFADVPVFTSFDGIRFRCAHNPNAYVTFRNANQANPGSIIFSAHDGNTGTAFHLVDKTLIPYNTNDMDLGTTSRKWKSINGINPGALSLPDLSNGIDISGYLTAGTSHNEYTPTVDGWISVTLKKTTTSGALALFIYQGGICNSYFGNTPLPNESEYAGMVSIPVKAGIVVNIDLKGANIYVYSAKFYPCQGNV